MRAPQPPQRCCLSAVLLWAAALSLLAAGPAAADCTYLAGEISAFLRDYVQQSAEPSTSSQPARLLLGATSQTSSQWHRVLDGAPARVPQAAGVRKLTMRSAGLSKHKRAAEASARRHTQRPAAQDFAAHKPRLRQLQAELASRIADFASDLTDDIKDRADCDASFREWGSRGRLHHALADYVNGALRLGVSLGTLQELEPAFKVAYHLMQKLAQRLYPWVPQQYNNFMAWRDSKAGRGIVMVAGKDYVQQAHLNLIALRSIHNCTLPVELWYGGEEDLPQVYHGLLSAVPNVTLRSLPEYFDPARVNLDPATGRGGWAMKPFAMLASSFAEQIFIDADVYFFQDPEVVFETEEYKRTGAIFYKDRTVYFFDKPNPENRVWVQKVIRRPSDYVRTTRWWNGKTEHECESGVVVVNMHRVWDGMLAVGHMNNWPARQDAYAHMWGDKETTWIAFEMVGQPYSISPGEVGFMSREPQDENKVNFEVASHNGGHLLHLFHTKQAEDQVLKICPPAMVQTDGHGSLLWWHNGVLQNKYLPGPSPRNMPFKPAVWAPDEVCVWEWDNAPAEMDGVGFWCTGILQSNIRHVADGDKGLFEQHATLFLSLAADNQYPEHTKVHG